VWFPKTRNLFHVKDGWIFDRNSPDELLEIYRGSGTRNILAIDVTDRYVSQKQLTKYPAH